MMVSYKDLCKTHIMNNPCPICGKRANMKDTKVVKVNGEEFVVCKHHHVEEDK
jgi:ribosome-binding protein aMBF1 (putative translation factor)